MNPRELSADGLQALRDSEALRLHAYPDPASDLAKASPSQPWGFKPAPEILAGLPMSVRILTGKPWTIGYGLTSYIDGRPVQPGDTCTPEQAEAWFRVIADRFARSVADAVVVPINQPMLDALANLAYNIGATAFRTSTLVRQLNAGRYIEAQAEFDRWVLSGGKRVGGLVDRRNREQKWFNDGIRSALAGQPEQLTAFNAAIGDEFA